MDRISILENIIYTVSITSSAICFINFGKLNKSFRWLGVFLLFAGLSQIIAQLLVINSGTNITFYNCVTLINLVLIFLVFMHVQSTPKTKKWLITIISLGFIITAAFVWRGLLNGQFSFRGLASMSVTVALGSLVVLFGMLRNPLNSSPLKMGWLWLLMGFLFYYASTFSYWTAINFLKELNTKLTLQHVNIILIIIFYLILLTAIIIQLKFGDANNNPKPRRSIKSSSLLQ